MATDDTVGQGGRQELPESETARQAREQEEQARLSWGEFVSAMYALKQDGYHVHRVSIKGAWASGDEFLVTLCARTDDGPMVAFHGSENVTTLWGRLARRIKSGGLRWKVDEYE